MVSCIDHPGVVDNYLKIECALGRLADPFTKAEVPEVSISPFGGIPKKGKDSRCLIIDLSTPQGHSINDRISQEWCSLSYVTIDMIADRIAEMGRGTQLAKIDIKSAFRNILVHQIDHCLLGMQWGQSICVDKVLHLLG